MSDMGSSHEEDAADSKSYAKEGGRFKIPSGEERKTWDIDVPADLIDYLKLLI
jgi:hypothetical protein